MTLEKLITSIHAHETPFYRDFWGDAVSYDALPYLTRAHIATTSHTERRYSTEKSITKIVSSPEPFLFEVALTSLRAERFGVRSKRPLVYFQDFHEAFEKSVWCYENDMTPLIAEKNERAATLGAEAYSCDSIICDQASLFLLEPFVTKHPGLVSVSVVDSDFNVTRLQSLQQQHMRLVLALPETGVIAEAGVDGVFLRVSGRSIELKGSRLIFSHEELRMTPLIRYDTELRVHVPQAIEKGFLLTQA